MRNNPMQSVFSLSYYVFSLHAYLRMLASVYQPTTTPIYTWIYIYISGPIGWFRHCQTIFEFRIRSDFTGFWSNPVSSDGIQLSFWITWDILYYSITYQHVMFYFFDRALLYTFLVHSAYYSICLNKVDSTTVLEYDDVTLHSSTADR